ncbi:DUF2971 domain-containing protein [Sphingobacterium faecium]|uniref:DUF2971 domain-containing protein n=1 Tax=Sphingobacterium faecium TaxID=34087 RepID=UPI003DA2EAF4
MDQLPETLYKYSPLHKYGKILLFQSELYAGSAAKQNDEMELSIPIKYSQDTYTLNAFISKYLAQLKVSGHLTENNYNEKLLEATDRYNFSIHNPQKYWKQSEDKILEMNHNFYGIICFSSNFNNNMMWGNYSNNNTGICIGFDREMLMKHFSKIKDNFAVTFGKVNYFDELPEWSFNAQENEQVTKNNFIKSTFSKQKTWIEEKEYRLIISGFQSIESKDRSIKYPKSIIREINIGTRISLTDEEEIIKFVRRENLKISVYKMKKSFTSLNLDRELICDNS